MVKDTNMDDISSIIIEASDESTLPDQLESIYQQHRNRAYKLKITNALASNPNASIELLKQLFINEPGMANVVLENPVLPLLLLENYEILKSWVIEGRNNIFIYKQPSEELQRIALSTNDKNVWLELVKLAYTDVEIVETIASSLDLEAKRYTDYQNMLIEQNIAKHSGTAVNRLIRIIRECYDNVRYCAYENATKHQDKKVEIDDYFNANPFPQQDWLINFIPKLESSISHRMGNKQFTIKDGNVIIQFDNYKIHVLTRINIICVFASKILLEYCSESKTIYRCYLSSEDMTGLESSFMQ
jgi:hypothetical protein